jgi:curved DNA-binding protein CbpA
MASSRPIEDPYRTLGILRGADLEDIKAAHRRLAKRFHPDGSMGDEQRFLAVQEAYQLLSDPQQRREWDRRHTPGPLSARERGTAASGGPARQSPRRGSRSSTATTGRRPEPGARSTTWSAEHVPWWQDFRPRGSQAPGSDAPEAHVDEGGEPGSAAMDFDVFSRSSGAAWSMAARRHFRRGDEDLPSRGAWRYRGTQVVTGAEARKVAAEEAAERAAREAGARRRDPGDEGSPR